MDSTPLDTPDGIDAKVGWDPKTTVHDRRRILARELVAARLRVDPKEVRVDREAPKQFGYHTQLLATHAGEDVPLAIKTASFGSATVVAVADPAVPMGLDIRDMHPSEDDVFTMQRHSHLIDEENIPALLDHWTRVQAVLEADGRGVRVHPEHVRLDTPLNRGWIRDRKVQYTLCELSRKGFIITLAYGALPL